MSLIDEIYRNRINVKQLIILFDTIKLVFAGSLSSFSTERLFNGECAEIHALLLPARLIEAGNSIISPLFFSVSSRGENRAESFSSNDHRLLVPSNYTFPETQNHISRALEEAKKRG